MASWWRSLWPDERVAAIGWMMAVAWVSVVAWPLLVVVGLALAMMATTRWLKKATS